MIRDAGVPWSRYQDRRSARRAAVREHHPDVGGSADDLHSALAEVDRCFRTMAGTAAGAEVVFRRTRLHNMVSRSARLYRRVCAHLPGTARYTAV